jgi:D-3-phosphoglycerate dehydrogenase
VTFRVFETGSGIAQEARDYLVERGCVLDRGRPQDSEEELEASLARFDPDALIVRQGRISRRVQMAAARLKVICKHGVGPDNIDIAAATERGIPVLFTPGANSEAAAEHTLALMLALLRRVRAMDHSVRSGAFDKSSYDGLELSGKTVGIIGFGRIGRRLAELLEPF